MDDLGAHRAYLEGPTFSRRTAALGPEFLLDHYVPKKKSEKERLEPTSSQGEDRVRSLSIRITNIRATRHAPWALNFVVA